MLLRSWFCSAIDCLMVQLVSAFRVDMAPSGEIQRKFILR